MVEEALGKKPLHILERLRLGVTRIVVIALVAIIVVGSIVAAYVALRPPSSSPSPTLTSAPTPSPTSTSAPTSTPTPTPSPMSRTHTVGWTTVANYQADFWNITIANPYTVSLNDTMTVSSGNQMLEVDEYPNTSAFASGIPPVWTVIFVSNTTFNFFIYATNGSMINSGYNLPCNNSIVQVVVTPTQIKFTGTSPVTTDVTFENLGQVVTVNDGGNFNGGQLDMTLTS